MVKSVLLLDIGCGIFGPLLVHVPSFVLVPRSCGLHCSLSTLLDIPAVSTVCDYLIFPPPHIPVPHHLQGELALVAPVFPHLCHCLSRGRVCQHEKQGVVDLRIVEGLVGSLEGLSSPEFRMGLVVNLPAFQWGAVN